jgi:hypothetical protein
MATKLIHDPSSHPVINSTVRTVMTLKASQEKLKCRIDALTKYNKAMIAAAKKLEKDLKRCS